MQFKKKKGKMSTFLSILILDNKILDFFLGKRSSLLCNTVHRLLGYKSTEASTFRSKSVAMF